MNLMEREKAGELSDSILRKQPTDALVDLGLALLDQENERHDWAIKRANRIVSIAHDLAAASGEHMGVEVHESRVIPLLKALEAIASHAGQTLISVEHGQPYSIGANAAFEQLAAIAADAIAAFGERP